MPGPGCDININIVLSQEKSGPHGVQSAFSIPVIIGNRKGIKLVRNEKSSIKSANLLSIACHPRNSPVSPVKDLHLALLNIRSLVGKSFLINDFINEHNLDFMFLTETWLSQDNSAAVLIESTPPNYSFFSEARVHKRGGGVATLFKDSFQCKNMWRLQNY